MIYNHLQSITGQYTMIYNDLKPFTINYRTINNHLQSIAGQLTIYNQLTAIYN
jgi:hypothetical protein